MFCCSLPYPVCMWWNKSYSNILIDGDELKQICLIPDELFAPDVENKYDNFPNTT